jgi:hypothetical protein
MKGLMKGLLGVLALLIAIGLIVFGIFWFGMGALFLAMGDIEGEPNAEPLGIGVLAILGGVLLCCTARLLLHMQIWRALLGAIVGLPVGVVLASVLVDPLHSMFHSLGFESSWGEWRWVVIPLTIWMPMVAGAIIGMVPVWRREQEM